MHGLAVSMIDEDLAHAILDIASRSTPVLAEVRLADRNSRSIAIRAGQVSSVSSSADAGMNVRIALPSGIGFASSNVVSKFEGSKLVKDALSQARKGRRKSPVTLSAEPAVRTSWEVRQHKSLADVSVDEKLEHLQDIDSAVVKMGVKVQGRYYELRDWEVTSYFANSEGSRIRSFIPRVKIESYNLVSAKGETEQSLREWAASGGWEKKDEWNLLEVLPDEVVMLKK